MHEARTIGVPRRALSIAAAAALALAGTVSLTTESQAAPKEHKVWVCKYVDVPGQAERLKDGKQPIEVDWHSLTADKTVEPYVGATFSDRHEKSVVVQVGGESPGRSACESKTPPTTPDEEKPTTPDKEKPKPTEKAKPKPKPGGAGGGVAPGVGAPDTGGSGESVPANGLVGTGLLLAAAGVLGRDLVQRRREGTTE